MTGKDTIKHLDWTGWASSPRRAGMRHLDPEDVLCDGLLSNDEKRAILADWASDSRAVEHMPGYRQLYSGALVWLDDIRSALVRLDTGDRDAGGGKAGKVARLKRPRLRLSDLLRTSRGYRRNDDDDDDDPPPTPAFALNPRGGSGGGTMSPAASTAVVLNALQAA